MYVLVPGTSTNFVITCNYFTVSRVLQTVDQIVQVTKSICFHTYHSCAEPRQTGYFQHTLPYNLYVKNVNKN